MDYEIRRRSNGGAVHMDLFIDGRRAAEASAYPAIPGHHEPFIDINWYGRGSLLIDDLTPEHAAAFAAGLGDMTARIQEEFAAILRGVVHPYRDAESLPVRTLSDEDRAIIERAKEQG